jgi:hypothetical protein
MGRVFTSSPGTVIIQLAAESRSLLGFYSTFATNEPH